MSELKAYIAPTADGIGLADYYLKSEADKVIADLEESHKKEVEQLLMEIAELKGDNERLRDESCKLTDGCLRLKQCRKEKANIADELLHQKYKRCLAMAEMCKARYDEEDARINGHGASWDYISLKMKYWERWQWRWEELAEKFKEVK